MTISESDILDQIRQINEYEFESLVAEIWKKYGWKTEVTSGSSDQGIDVVATKSLPFEQKIVIQAKRYEENNTVGSPDIQQYSSLRHQEEGVDAVIVITTSSFTSAAENIANNLNVKLIDGEKLVRLILEVDSESIIKKYTAGNSNLGDRLLVEDYLDRLGHVPWESSKLNTKCPFCRKEVAATKQSFTQHWKDNDNCSPK
jgi:restriction endonuclease Mrr